MAVDCHWNVLTESHRTVLGVCLLVMGSFGTIVNVWFIIVMMKSNLLSFKSNIMLLNMSCASLLRNLFAGFIFSGTSAIANRWLFSSSCCRLFGFVNHFIGVYQIESLTHMCLERYIDVKFYRQGKEISLKLYAFFMCLCWCFSFVYSFPPLLGLGGYSCDVTGTACTLDWSMAGTRHILFNIVFILLAGVKTVIVMSIALWRAIINEQQYYAEEKHSHKILFTKSTIVAVVVSLALWTPQALLTIWLFTMDANDNPPSAIAFLAPISSEAATSALPLCYLGTNTAFRTALLSGKPRTLDIAAKNK